MRDQVVTTSKYGFIIIVFLVVALTFLLFFTNRYKQNSAQLASTVNNLSHTRNDEELIDSALGLLYIAENNARMYALYNNLTYYNTYSEQLKSVRTLIDSLSSSKNEDDSLNALVNDKQIKTQLFLKAQFTVDSLLLSENKPKVETPKYVTHLLPPLDTSFTTIDTSTNVAATATQPKQKKGLFKRLSDAFRNKQDTAMQTIHDKILIQKYTRDSIVMKYTSDSLRLVVSDLKDRQGILDNLKQKERSVLNANHKLFYNLESLLQQLKKVEVGALQVRNKTLGKNALSFTEKLRINNKAITLFGIILSAIILIVLFILYRNELALNKSKKQAENYAKLKSEFTATISHEIRTPLHSINAFANELSASSNHTQQTEAIDAIKLSSGVLLSIVNNILDFTKIEKGKFKLESVPFNPQKVIKEILAGVKIQANTKRLELVGNIDDTTNREVLGDAFQLRQIILNVLSNAIKYTDKGCVTLHANIASSSSVSNQVILYLHIRDTGSGIAQEDLAHLFDEFSNHNHQSEVTMGSSGLGLNIVKQMVDLHQGKIFVDSQVNKGTVFSIEIPYQINANSNHTISAPVNNTNNLSLKGLKILLVENDTFNQKFLSQLLTKHHAVVDMAQDGEEALELFNQNKYDLILTDIGLPKICGISLAKTVRQTSDIIIFGITGFDQEIVVKNQNIFNEWLVKPVKSEDLLKKIKEYFPNKNAS